MQALDPRERRFVQLYVESNNGAQSAMVAGYGSSLKVAATLSYRLLMRSEIKAAIDHCNAKLMTSLDMGPLQIKRRLAWIAKQEPADGWKGSDIVKAMEQLAKIGGMFPQDRQWLIDGKIEHHHTVDIEQLDSDQRDQLKAALSALQAKQIDAKPISED
jgi:phage terminase small subunit